MSRIPSGYPEPRRRIPRSATPSIASARSPSEALLGAYERRGAGVPGLLNDVQVRRYPVRVLGINAIFHDPSAALVVDGRTVAALEEERVSRRKHGKRPVPFSAWELPEQS